MLRQSVTLHNADSCCNRRTTSVLGLPEGDEADDEQDKVDEVHCVVDDHAEDRSVDEGPEELEKTTFLSKIADFRPSFMSRVPSPSDKGAGTDKEQIGLPEEVCKDDKGEDGVE